MTELPTTVRLRFASLWRHLDFLKLGLGQAISEMGSRVTRDGLRFAAVLVLGATATQIGVLAAIGSAVVLFTSLPLGVLNERKKSNRELGLRAAALGTWITSLIAAGGIVLSSRWLVFSPVRHPRDRPERAKIEEICS